MSPADLRRVHDAAAGHPRRGRGPLLHLQRPGGQHDTGGDDSGHPEL